MSLETFSKIIRNCKFWNRLDMDLPSTSSKPNKTVDEAPAFNKIGYNSFGKASITSSFSAKSGGSTSTTGNENLDSLLKTISKDTNNAMTNIHESLNDVNSIRCEIIFRKILFESILKFCLFCFFVVSIVAINKTSDLENNTDTLKELSMPNNQTKLASVNVAPLLPSQYKCNILKGRALYTLNKL